MTVARLKLGRQGENAAAGFLQTLGMKILERNLRTPVGEIDLIVRQKRFLIFVEVKTRRGTALGQPAEAVGPRKQQQIIRAAQWYLATNDHHKLQPRFDVVSVLADGETWRCQHIPNAFEA